MRIAVFGGTGQLGHFVIKHLHQRGHQCLAIGLGGAPERGFLPPTTEFLPLNLETAEVHDLAQILNGYDVVIHSTGADGRNLFATPAIDSFRRANVEPVARLIQAMKLTRSRNLVILGSYYTAMERIFPSLDLSSISPYIASRKEQNQVAFASAGPEISVAILELPYIFGAAPGRSTLWGFYIDQIKTSKDVVQVHSGGTACVTMNQVGMATATACESHVGHRNYPMGGTNLKYREIFELFCRHLGMSRSIVTAPANCFAEKALEQVNSLATRGLEGAYHPVKFLDVEEVDLYMDPGPAMQALSYGHESISEAIRESVVATCSPSNKM